MDGSHAFYDAVAVQSLEDEIATVRGNGLHLADLDDGLQAEVSVALAAVKDSGTAIFATHPEACSREVVLAAAKRFPEAIMWADDTLFDDDDFLEQACQTSAQCAAITRRLLAMREKKGHIPAGRKVCA